ADPRLSTVSTDKLPSTNNIRSNNAILLQHLKTISAVLSPIADNYDYILIDSHPEVSDVMRSIIYASDYCVSPVKLDRQSSIGVATVIGEINNVNEDIEMLRKALQVGDSYKDT
ncbi:AAA family ATPase, partial [Escherichia coli]|nr:AAA family ATPase [Escherichia coli]